MLPEKLSSCFQRIKKVIPPTFFIWIKRIILGIILFIFSAVTYFSFSPSLPNEKHPIIFYSTQTQDNLKLILSKSIKMAEKSLFLLMYAFTEEDLLSLFQEKIAQGNCDVKVFYDPSGSPNLKKPPSGHFIPLYSSGIMHKKILVIDQKITYLGSTNFTGKSLSMHDNLLVGIYHEGLSSFLTSSLEDAYFFSLPHQNAEIYLLPDPQEQALRKILSLVEKAKQSITIAMFTFTHPDIVNALLNACQRGIKIKIAVDFYSANGASKKVISRLQEAGCTIFLSRGQKLLHYKWCLIDNKIFINGSANWTKAAFTKNEDCLLILDKLLISQKKFIHKIWREIEKGSL